MVYLRVPHSFLTIDETRSFLHSHSSPDAPHNYSAGEAQMHLSDEQRRSIVARDSRLTHGPEQCTGVHDLNCHGETRLFTALRSYVRSPSTMRSLLARGVDPNIARHGGKTVLMLACSSGNTEAVRTLLRPVRLETGECSDPIDTEPKDQFGKRAMDYALSTCGGAGTAEERERAAEAHPLVRTLRAYTEAQNGAAVPVAEHSSADEAEAGHAVCPAAPSNKHQLDAWRPSAVFSASGSDTCSAGNGSSGDGGGSSSSSSSSSSEEDDEEDGTRLSGSAVAAVTTLSPEQHRSRKLYDHVLQLRPRQTAKRGT